MGSAPHSRRPPAPRTLWSSFPVRRGRQSGIVPVLALIAAVAAWWAVTALAVIDPLFLPSPLSVVRVMGLHVQSGILWIYAWPTLSAALLGSLIALAVALPLAYIVAHSPMFATVIEPAIMLTQTVPLVALAPLIMLWIGNGTVPIAVLCAIIAFFPMATTAIVGLRSLDSPTIEHALLDGTTWWQRLWLVEAPMAAPAVLHGIRSGAVLSMTGAIVGEFVIGGSGLGTLLSLSRDSVNTAAVFAVVIWIALMALAIHGGVLAVERAASRRLQGAQS